MQSNETEREDALNFIALKLGFDRGWNEMQSRFVTAEALEAIADYFLGKTLQARIDELEQVWAQTKPAVPINTWIFYRLEDLKSQLPKKERNV